MPIIGSIITQVQKHSAKITLRMILSARFMRGEKFENSPFSAPAAGNHTNAMPYNALDII